MINLSYHHDRKTQTPDNNYIIFWDNDMTPYLHAYSSTYLFINSPKFHPDTVWNDIIRRGSGSIYTPFRMDGDFPFPREYLTCVMRIAYLCPYVPTN